MNFLLTAVNAKYIHSNPAVHLLKACVKPEDRAFVRVLEFTINEFPDEILDGIVRTRPDWIGFSCYIWNMKTISWILREIRKVLPQVRIWLGGPEVSFDPVPVLKKHPSVDGVFTGEGEIPVSRLIHLAASAGPEALDDPTALAEIPGICFRNPAGSEDSMDSDRFVTTQPAPAEDISRLPFLYSQEFGGLEPYKNKIIYYESSRGCPFSCAYCVSSQETGTRLRDPDLVRSELQFFLDRKLPQVKFLDRTFNCREDHALAIWQFLKERDNGITNFHFELEADLLTEKELDLMTSLRPGQIQVEIGVQSTDPAVLKAVRRRTKTDHLEACARRLIDAGNMHVHLDLIAGLPKDTWDTFRRSFDDIWSLRPHELQLGFLKVLPGTPLASETEVYDIKYIEDPPYEVLSTGTMSYSELRRLKRIEDVLEIYGNSSQFARTMTVLEKFFPDPFSMYEGLADWFDARGYFRQKPSRTGRFLVLLDFIRDRLAGLGEQRARRADLMFRELLTCDTYLRSRAVKRPDFAEEWGFRKNPGGNVHDELFHWDMTRIRPHHSDPVPEDFLSTYSEEGYLIRFRYENRDPVTKDAETQVLASPYALGMI